MVDLHQKFSSRISSRVEWRTQDLRPRRVHPRQDAPLAYSSTGRPHFRPLRVASPPSEIVSGRAVGAFCAPAQPGTGTWTKSSERGYLACVNLAREICTVKYYKDYTYSKSLDQIIYLGFRSGKRKSSSSNGTVLRPRKESIKFQRPPKRRRKGQEEKEKRMRFIKINNAPLPQRAAKEKKN
jgi:hypothetical protein